jgi:WD40 repeat protein
MLQPRSWHSATLLSDGKVLVAGGLDASGASTATSEVYDPATGTFAAVGNLPSKSAGHTATLLNCGLACANNGRVLLAGGGNSSAGIFNPATRTWSPTGGIGGNRSYHTATVLSNGRVLIVGGSDNSDKPLATTLLFDPATGSFANGPSLAVARERHVAVLLPDNRVLVAGGRAKSGSGYTVIASAEIYNPSTGTFSPAGNLVAGRHSAEVELLSDGRVLVTGGSSDTTASAPGTLGSSELYAAGTWALGPALVTARKDFTLTTMADGKLLVAGGQGSAGRLGLAEFYTVVPGGLGAFAAAPPMLTPRSAHTATRLQDGRVLVVGGLGSTGTPISASEYYRAGP